MESWVPNSVGLSFQGEKGGYPKAIGAEGGLEENVSLRAAEGAAPPVKGSPLPVLAKENARKLVPTQGGFLEFRRAFVDFRGSWAGRG